jgi:hypothetical protein
MPLYILAYIAHYAAVSFCCFLMYDRFGADYTDLLDGLRKLVHHTLAYSLSMHLYNQ